MLWYCNFRPSFLGLKTFCAVEPKKWYLNSSQPVGSSHLRRASALRAVFWAHVLLLLLYIDDLIDCVTSSTAKLIPSSVA